MLEIELDLNRHCIETAIKRMHNRLLSEYFSSRGGNAALEDQLALLQEALTRFDFPYLRTTYRELAGNSNSRVTLNGDRHHPPAIAIDGRSIDTGSFVSNNNPW